MQNLQNNTANPDRLLPPSNGVHTWVMGAAWECRKRDLTPDQAIGEIRATEGLLRSGRTFSRGEVEVAVEKAYACEVIKHRRTTAPKPIWPKWCGERTAAIHAELEMDPCDLWERSPIRIEEQTPEDFLDDLFGAGNPLLCCGWGMDRFETRRRDDWRGNLDGLQLIVPAPMTARTGRTQDGRESAHTLENTGTRIYAVVDLDDPPPEHHASILWHLAEFAPLALVLRSGGKGLHGWYRMRDLCRLHDFYRYACLCGADPVLYRNPSQFVRLPHGIRDNGRRQAVLFINPENTLRHE